MHLHSCHDYRLLGSKRKVSKYLCTRMLVNIFYNIFTILSESGCHFFFQLGGPDHVAEMTGRRGMLVRAQSGKGVIYQARNT